MSGSFGTSKYEANTSELVLDEVLFCGAFARAPGMGGDGVVVLSGARRLLAEAPN